MFLFWSGRRDVIRPFHQKLGKVLFPLVLVLAPSGFVMAFRAHTGLFARIGFAFLAGLTFLAMSMSLFHIRKGNLSQHIVWSSRLFVLLLSPLLLRIISRAAILFDFDLIATYQFSAWASWLLPLFVLEISGRIASLNLHHQRLESVQ
jgi:hypothetical protein